MSFTNYGLDRIMKSDRQMALEHNYTNRNTWTCYHHYYEVRRLDQFAADAAGGQIRAFNNGYRPAQEWIVAKLKTEIMESERFARTRDWVKSHDDYVPINGSGTLVTLFSTKVARRVLEFLGVSVCCALPEGRWNELLKMLFDEMKVHHNSIHRMVALKMFEEGMVI